MTLPNPYQTTTEYGQQPYYGAVPRTGPTLAGPGRRLAARVLDGLITFVGFAAIGSIGYLMALAIDGDKHDPGAISITLMILFAVLGFAFLLLYEPIFTWKRGGPLGKLALGIRVVRTTDGRSWPSFGMSLWRYLFQALMSFVPFGRLLDSLWLLWDRPLYQCLHDKVASTVVVRAT